MSSNTTKYRLENPEYREKEREKERMPVIKSIRKMRHIAKKNERGH